MSTVADVRWVELPSHKDERGVLTSVEAGRDIPFEIYRIFYMHHVIMERGGHAHPDTDQVAVVVSGDVKIEVSDRLEKRTFHLNDATKGLYLPRMIFTRLYDFSPQAVCLVLASTHYDRSRSIRTWEDYLESS